MRREVRQALDVVRRDVRGAGLWQAGDRLLLGCSGGRDSIAMWGLLDALAPSLGHGLVIGHVDHGLQDTGGALAAVQEAAERLGTPWAIERLALEAGPELQGRAREARYAALERMADAHGARWIVTAHHADDQAETVLMRAMRGAGSGALQGIRQRRGRVLRPALGLTRAQLNACAEAWGLRWWSDPSNTSTQHTRNRVRYGALPALESAHPGAARGIARTAANLGEEAAALGHWVAVALGPARVVDGCLQVPRERLPTDPALLGPALGWVTSALGLPRPSRAAIQQIAAALASDSPCNVHGLRLTPERGSVRFSARLEAPRPPARVACPQGADYPASGERDLPSKGRAQPPRRSSS